MADYQPVQYTGTNYNQPASAPASTVPAAQYQSRINQQLDSLSQPVDPNSATVRAQTDPFAVATQRGLRQNQNAIAEQNYAGGNLHSGANDQMQQQARENASLATAQNTGQVVGQAEAQRQQQLGNFMNLGQSGALQQQGITAQQNQFADTLGLNEAQMRSQEGQFGANLGSQQGMFGANLAQNQNQFNVTSGQNQTAINNALEIAKMQNKLGYYTADTNYNLGEDNLTGNLLGS